MKPKHRNHAALRDSPMSSNKFDSLPADLARHQILKTAQAAAFCNYSVSHWRRLYRSGAVPRPIKLSPRRFGWRIGDLTDWLEQRSRILD